MSTDGGMPDAISNLSRAEFHFLHTSRHPAAKAFVDWLHDELLEALRKTGHYEANDSAQAILDAATELVQRRRTMAGGEL
jgi:prophage antirepressor-like protein